MKLISWNEVLQLPEGSMFYYQHDTFRDQDNIEKPYQVVMIRLRPLPTRKPVKAADIHVTSIPVRWLYDGQLTYTLNAWRSDDDKTTPDYFLLEDDDDFPTYAGGD